MEVYIIYYGLILCGALIGINHKRNLRLYLPLVVITILFAGLRGNGFDWESYEEIYRNISGGGTQSTGTFVEYGFEFLILLSPFYKVLIFFSSVISLSFTFYGVLKFSKNILPLLGLLVFSTTLLLPTYMGQIRQGIAMGFFCMGVYEAYIKEYKKAFYWILTACFFHISAVLGFVIFFIPRKQYSLWIYLIVIGASLALYNVVMMGFANLLGLSSLGVVRKLLFYATTENQEIGINSTILIRIAMLVITLVFNKGRNEMITYLSNVYLCGILVYLLFGFLPQLGIRGALYFSVFEMVLVPFIVYSLRRQSFLYFCAYMCIIGLSFYRLYAFFSSDFYYHSYIPYFLY